MSIFAFSDFNPNLLEKIKSLEGKIIFCGGLNFFQQGRTDSFEILKRLKEEKRSDFIILLSPSDIEMMGKILDIFNFVKNGKALLKGEYKLVKIDRTKNLLDFKNEYSNVLKTKYIERIISGERFNIDDKLKRNLFSLIKSIGENNPFNLRTIKFILENSKMIHEDDFYIFTSEQGEMSYKPLDELNELYNSGIDSLIEGRPNKFISNYKIKHKKITLPELSKTFIVGNSDKFFDIPFFKKNCVFINCSANSGNYIENGQLVTYSNDSSFSYVEIIDNQVKIHCINLKGEIIDEFITNQCLQIEEMKFENSETTKNYALRVSSEYYAIPIKSSFFVAKFPDLILIEQNISDLIEEKKEHIDENTEFKSISELVVKYKPILKKEDQDYDLEDLLDEQSVSSKGSGRRISFSEIFDYKTDSSDEER